MDNIFRSQQPTDMPLTQLFEQIKKVGDSLLFSGYAILSKDLSEYLAARGHTGMGIDTFRNAVNEALQRDRQYFSTFWPEAFANLYTLKDIPNRIAEEAEKGEFKLPQVMTEEGMNDVEKANNPIMQDWTRFLGWAFFREYSYALRDTITEVQDQTISATEEDSDLIPEVVLAEQLLDSDAIPNERSWYPLVIYLSVLLFRTDFATVPETEPVLV